MALPDPCPFCGGRPIRMRPMLSGTAIGASAGGAGASLRAPRSKEFYLRCNGCTMEYVPANRDMHGILAGLRMSPWIEDQVRHHYGEGVAMNDLLADSVTAVVRKASHHRSLMSVSASKNELIVCFCLGGVRTFGSFVRRGGRRWDRRRGGSGKSYYLLRELSMA